MAKSFPSQSDHLATDADTILDNRLQLRTGGQQNQQYLRRECFRAFRVNSKSPAVPVVLDTQALEKFSVRGSFLHSLLKEKVVDNVNEGNRV